MDFGATIKAAREAKGLSVSQVAAQTHLLVQVVERMECNDFSMIPAPIYGRGFVRLISECLGLDAAVMTAEYMRASHEGAAPAPSAAPAPERSRAVDLAVSEPVLPEAEAPAPSAPVASASPDPAPAEERETPPDLAGLELFDPDAGQRAMQPEREASDSGFSRFAAPLPDDDYISPADRFRAGLSAVSGGILHTFRGARKPIVRIAALVLAAALVAALAAWGMIALFRATSAAPAAEVRFGAVGDGPRLQ